MPKENIVLKLLSRIRKILNNACLYYTVLSLALYTGGMLASGIEREWIPTLKMMCLTLLFSAVFSAANEIVFSTSLPGILKILLHYAATVAGFYVMFILWGGYGDTASSVFMILLAFTLVYAAAALLVFFFRYAFSIKKSNGSAYASQFADSRTRK